MKAFNIWLSDDLLDTVFMDEDMDEQDVYVQLTNRGEFPYEITVQEVEM